MDFGIALAIYFLENTIEVELGGNVQHQRTSKLPIYVPCEKIIVKHCGGLWGPSKKWKKRNINIKSSVVRTTKNNLKRPGYIVIIRRIYSCAIDALYIIKFRG